MSDSDIGILDLFDKKDYTETSSAFKMECPCCGLQGGRTEGFILFPETNTAYCHSSGKTFWLLEAYALKNKIIQCIDGREKGDSQSKVLGGELFTITLEAFKNEFGSEKFEKLLNQLKIRKEIELPRAGRYVSSFADELGDIYKSRNVLFFRGESRSIVEIAKYKRNNDANDYSENGFAEIDSSRFVTLIEMFTKPKKTYFDKTTGEETVVYVSMSQSTAGLVLSSPNFQDKLPIINRIFDIQIPIIYKGELTFPEKGYDKRFGSWLPFNSPQIKKDSVSLEDAKKVIDYIFQEFCFESDKDKTYAIAGFITPFLRGLFPTFSTRTPVFIYMANRERAGKDYCAGCTGMLYEGNKIEQPAICNDEKGYSNFNDEIRKKITACMLQGKKRFHSANNKGHLNNSVFEGVTTAEIWEDRILGKSEKVTLSNEIDYSLSGNVGISLTPDLANRSRIINLHLVDEDANARKFNNPNLHKWIYDNREYIISALFTLIKNWFDKGKPEGSIPFTSFPEWAKICGGIMECAGYDNPCVADNKKIISLYSESEEMKILFDICYNKKPDVWLNKDDIKELIANEDIMDYFDFNNKADQTKFGLKIDKYVNRYLSGIFMKVDSLEQRANRRRYKFTKNDKKVVKSGNLGNLGNVELSIGTFQKRFSYDSLNVTNVTKVTKTLKKQKNDRELQFWESPECENIKSECTKEDVYKYIKENPKKTYKELDKDVGLGCLKFVGELLEEGLIEENENEGWKIKE